MMTNEMIDKMVSQSMLNRFKKDTAKLLGILRRNDLSEADFKDVVIYTHKTTGERHIVHNKQIIGTL